MNGKLGQNIDSSGGDADQELGQESMRNHGTPRRFSGEDQPAVKTS